MFTLKLFRGANYGRDANEPPHSQKIVEAHTVEVHNNVQSDGNILRGKHIVIDKGLSSEWHYYLDHPDGGLHEPFDWAVVENASGKTTEVLRP